MYSKMTDYKIRFQKSKAFLYANNEKKKRCKLKRTSKNTFNNCALENHVPGYRFNKKSGRFIQREL